MKLRPKQQPAPNPAPDPTPGNYYIEVYGPRFTLKNLSYELTHTAYKAFMAKLIDVQSKISNLRYSRDHEKDRFQVNYLRTLIDYRTQLKTITSELKRELE